MKEHTLRTILRSTFTALFAALICAGCFISIPVPGSALPIAVQNMLCMLAGGILGGIHGAGAVGLFIILGVMGLPVFSGGHKGFSWLAGPTGGYLWGYFIGALLVGLILGTPHVSEKKFSIMMWIKIALASLLGYAVVYAPGIPWFMHLMKGQGNPVSFERALRLMFIPFIPGDVIKLIATVPLVAVLRPAAARFLYPAEEKELREMLDDLKARDGSSSAADGN